MRLVEVLAQDMRHAARRVRRHPGFTALVATTLALGVGLNAAMFGLVDALLFRLPVHVDQPEQLVRVENVASYPRYRELGERLRSLDLAAFTHPQALTLGAGPSARLVTTQCVSATYFDVLGVRAHVGRTFAASDVAPGVRPVVLSHGYWSRHLGSDPSIAGQTVLISRRPHRVVGVAPAAFRGLAAASIEGWLLIGAAGEACPGLGGAALLRSEDAGWLTAIGRPRSGVAFTEAAAELAAVEVDAIPLAMADGEVIEMRATISPVYPSRRPSPTREGQIALWLAGGAGLLLLLACANVGGLLAMRAMDRRREIAIRLQLGGSRFRVCGQLLAEHLLMAGAGAVLAVLVAGWSAAAFGGFLALPADAVLLDARVLAVVSVLAIATGLASGSVPALHATRALMVAHLRTGQGVAPDGMRGRAVLLMTQVALALLLVAGTGLFVRSVERYRADFAYDIDRLVSVTLDPGAMDQPQAAVAETFETLQAAAQRLPRVERAVVASGNIGFGGSGTIAFMRRQGSDREGAHEVTHVSPGYFAALGLRVTRGRPFTEQDGRERRRRIILNEPLARELFGARDPVGECVILGRTCHEVVGVVQPFRSTVPEWIGDETHAFLPFGPGTGEATPAILMVRTRGAASEHLAVLRASLQGASPDLPFVTVRPVAELVDLQAASWLLGARAFGLFGALAVLLVAVGIYGALAFAIRQRRVEIGLRMAVGAMPADVVRLVLRHAAGIVGAGAALGLLAAAVASRSLESLLFKVAAADPLALAGATVLVAAAGLAGSVVPALRASRVDPVEALRAD